MTQWLDFQSEFIESLKLDRGASFHTLSAYASDLRAWQKAVPEHYEPALIHRAIGQWRENGLSRRSAARRITTLKQYLLFLAREKTGTLGPSSANALTTWIEELPSVRFTPEPPRTLSGTELKRLLDFVIEEPGPQGFRNRALILLLYGAGLRVSELVALKLNQIDWTQSAVRVVGKGAKERLVPLADPAREALREWIETAPPELDSTPVFCSLSPHHARTGGLTRQGVWAILQRLGLSAGVTQRFSPHTLRHAFASHLLAGGMNLRHLQQLLGHASVATTEIYTHLEKGQLKDTLRSRHPRGKVNRPL